ncbi:MAG: hypothetical protein JWO88_37, partial [Frankiales bacterium]|nr:hypothetical protein [Frankiales bacterium]
MTPTLHGLMEAATSDLTPRPDLLADARAGGRRRLRRRHVTVAVTLSVVLALTGLTADTVRSWHPSTPSYAIGGPLGDGGVHGDLANDTQYAGDVLKVLAQWFHTVDESRYGQPFGSSKILWAATTPGGAAAVVEQTVQVGKRRKTALWFIGPGPSGPRVAANNLDYPRTAAWYVDLDHRVLAVLDNGTDREVGFRWKYTPDGQARHVFEPLPFRDGVAVVTLPADVHRDTVQVVDLPYRAYNDTVGIGNVELGSVLATGLAWTDPSSKFETLIPFMHSTAAQMGPTGATLAERFSSRAQSAFDSHTDAVSGNGMYPTWYVYGTTPRGHQVVVFQRQLATDPARLYAFIDTG